MSSAGQPGRRRRVLMMCYYFPPVHTVGSLRSVGFAERLQSFGWEPIVLTVRTAKDRWAARGAPVPETLRIHRSAELDLFGLTQVVQGVLVRLARVFGRKITTNVLLEYLCMPDPQIAWFSTLKAIWLARNVDCVYASCGPFSSAVSARLVSKLTGKPCILDFRDLWSFNALLRASRFRRFIVCRLERWVLRGVQYLVVNTETAAQMYRGAYPEMSDRVVAIPNGFDVLNLAKPKACTDDYVIMHAGTFHGDRTPDLLLDALADMKDPRIRFVQIGDGGGASEKFRGRLDATFVETMSHERALEAIATASLLYLKQGRADSLGAVAAKTYDYLATGLPILIECPPGENVELVQRYAVRSYVVTTERKEDLERALRQAVSEAPTVTPAVSPAFIERFSRIALTARLAAVFAKAVEGEAGQPPDTANTLGPLLRRSLVWLATTTTLAQTVSWLMTLLVARVLTPSDYGLVALYETFTPFLASLASFGLSTWLVQAGRVEIETEEAVFALSTLLASVAAAVMFLSAPLLAAFYGASRLSTPVRIMAFLFLIQSLQGIPTARLQRRLDLRPIGLMTVFVGVSRGLLTLVMALLGFGYWALFVGIIYHEIARSLWLLVSAGTPARFVWRPLVNRAAINFGLPLTASTLLWMLYTTSDNIVVGKLFSPQVLGLYATAYYLSDLPLSKINGVIQPAILPFYSAIKGDAQKLAAAFLRVVRAVAFVQFPLLSGLGVVAPHVVPLVLGPKWADMVRPLQVMCVVGMLRGLTTSSSVLFQALGRTRVIFVTNAVTAALLLPSFALLGRWVGLNGIYATWLVVFPLTAWLSLLPMKGSIGVTPAQFLGNLRGPVFASLAMAALVALADIAIPLSVAPAIRTAFEITLGVAIYAAVLLTCFRHEAADAFQILRAHDSPVLGVVGRSVHA